ncbi:MAG: GCN5 family acetyltransferase [bacterium]|nr:GCN5 family acetyltransferase [bacterium]
MIATRLPTLRCGALLCLIAAASACGKETNETSLPPSEYPVAVDPAKVGSYPARAKSGGGYFYDEVLEYRVWVDSTTAGDTFRAFPTFEQAKEYSDRTANAEAPLALVLQREHVNEPEKGRFEHKKDNRITEWLVEWLADNRRGPDSIAEFLRKGGK